MSVYVTLFEMGPRDGLQNEKSHVDTTNKIRLVDELSGCGFRKIEVTSFVSSKWVPQMADSVEVMAGISRKANVSYATLTPNIRGFVGALASNANEVAVFASASEGFSQKNINCSIDESLKRFEPVVRAARDNEIPVRGYVSCITNCPYDGEMRPEEVATVAFKLLEMGCYEISLGDTVGAATPDKVSALLDTLLLEKDAHQFAGHFHDTRGLALSNIEVCLDHGIRNFDAAVGGLGGCPYAPGAKGNVATEAVTQRLHELGYETGLDLDRVKNVAEFAKSLRSPN